MNKRLSNAQIEAFHSDGFLSPIDLFSEDEALRLRNELEDAEKRWPEAFQGAARKNAHLNLKCLDEIVHNSALVDIIEDLIGVVSRMLWKFPGGVLRACEGSVFQAARSRGSGSMG